MKFIQQQDNFLPVDQSDDFWDKFADITCGEDWDETIERMLKEGWNVQMVWLAPQGDDWPDGLLFGDKNEKLKFLLKYSS